ncbi:putative 4-coumarate--CoA ligase 5 [Hordeum vulgare]|nr:putative 4-coumarate--CoA ligase 5 [Hordeum vulgare]
MSNHWASIQRACNKWHGIQEEVMARPESGNNAERQVRFALAKAKDGVYNPDTPVSWAAEERPDGNKNEKKARDSAAASERRHASIEQCIADTKSHSAMREEKSEARWSVLTTKQAAKLDLLRTKD